MIDELRHYFNTQLTHVYKVPRPGFLNSLTDVLKIGIEQGFIETLTRPINTPCNRYCLSAKGQRLLYPNNMEDLLGCYEMRVW